MEIEYIKVYQNNSNNKNKRRRSQLIIKEPIGIIKEEDSENSQTSVIE